MGKQIILTISFLSIFFFQSYATHIVGGDVTYDCLGFNADTTQVTLRIEFTMYRDTESGGANFDNDAQFGIWNGSGNNWAFYRDFDNQSFTDQADIDIDDDPCVEIPAGVGVEKAVYRFNVILDLNGDDYIIGYQRCCRNPTITNLINPGDTGAAFQIEITSEALLLCNNSPTFNKFPPIFVCANSDIGFDHSATDAEGDILVYEFCAPLQAGGTVGTQNNPGNQADCDGVRPSPVNCRPTFDPVDYAPGFNALNPMQGNPVVTIDATTGLISGAPTNIGQYVVGICVKEFRDGVLLGEIRRDFQFNTVICTPTVFAEIDAGVVGIDDLTYNIASCGENTVTIENTSFQESSIQYQTWWFETAPGDTIYLNTWDATVTFDDIGQYSGGLILNEGLSCSDSASVLINIFPSIETNFGSAYDTCIAGPVMFTDSTFTGADDVVAWDWDFNDGGISNQPNPNYLFEEPGEQRVTLIATDSNECKDTISQDITWYPVPPLLIVQPSKFLACAPGEISFVNLSDPINEEYTINWDFGDGTTASEISPIHTFEDPGVYSVDLEIISPIGCKTQKSYTNWITVEEKPTANFTFDPQDPDVFNREVNFTDLSIDSENQQWNFNNEFISLEQNPTYTFQDTGLYEIRLIAFHETGCPDTIIKLLDIEPLIDYFMPNAFTPNGDGDNDEFKGKGYIEGLKDFEFNIWNRWGEQVFSSIDPYSGWNGRKQNNGEMSPQGVYVWEIRFIGPRGGDESVKGHVTLLR